MWLIHVMKPKKNLITILTFSAFGTTPAFFLWGRERNQFKGTFAVWR